MNFLFYAKSLKDEVVKGAYIPAACSHTGKHYIVDTNKNYHEIDPESLGLKLPYRFIAEDRICSYAKVIMVKPNNNFDRVTESPEKLAEFISKVTIAAWFAQANSELPNPNGSREWLTWLKQEKESE